MDKVTRWTGIVQYLPEQFHEGFIIPDLRWSSPSGVVVKDCGFIQPFVGEGED